MSTNITQEKIEQLVNNTKTLIGENTNLKAEIIGLKSENAQLIKKNTDLETEIQRLQARLATAEQQARIATEKARDANDKLQKERLDNGNLVNSDEGKSLLAEIEALNLCLEQGTAFVSQAASSVVEEELNKEHHYDGRLCGYAEIIRSKKHGKEYTKHIPCQNPAIEGTNACEQHGCGRHFAFKDLNDHDFHELLRYFNNEEYCDGFRCSGRKFCKKDSEVFEEAKFYICYSMDCFNIPECESNYCKKCNDEYATNKASKIRQQKAQHQNGKQRKGRFVKQN